MNGNIKRLLQIAEKDSRDITGTMSGTSLDGLDIAYCNIKGEGRTTQVDLLHVKTIYYPKKAQGGGYTYFWKASRWNWTFNPIESMAWLLHGELILSALADWGYFFCYLNGMQHTILFKFPLFNANCSAYHHPYERSWCTGWYKGTVLFAVLANESVVGSRPYPAANCICLQLAWASFPFLTKGRTSRH